MDNRERAGGGVYLPRADEGELIDHFRKLPAAKRKRVIEIADEMTRRK